MNGSLHNIAAQAHRLPGVRIPLSNLESRTISIARFFSEKNSCTSPCAIQYWHKRPQIMKKIFHQQEPTLIILVYARRQCHKF